MAYINDNRFILERYHSGGSNRYECPHCGQKKCFTRYIDTETGEYIADDCGKCNHDSSCGYHYPPRDYFRDHPEYKIDGDNYEPDGGPYVLTKTQSFKRVEVPVYHQTVFFDLAWAEKAMLRQSTFRTWFESLPFDEERIQEVLSEYYVGGTANNVIKDGINYGPAAVFFMIDDQQCVHDAKMIAYTSDGHRVPEWGNSLRSVCEKSGIGPQLQWTEKVLFGLHLTAKHPDKPVCIVESEKTALVCACRYPDFVWVATGGCGNLQSEKLKPLMNRKLLIFPDSGELAKWRELMVKSGHKDYRCVEFMEDFEPNNDVADVILGKANYLTF